MSLEAHDKEPVVDEVAAKEISEELARLILSNPVLLAPLERMLVRVRASLSRGKRRRELAGFVATGATAAARDLTDEDLRDFVAMMTGWVRSTVKRRSKHRERFFLLWHAHHSFKKSKIDLRPFLQKYVDRQVWSELEIVLERGLKGASPSVRVRGNALAKEFWDWLPDGERKRWAPLLGVLLGSVSIAALSGTASADAIARPPSPATRALVGLSLVLPMAVLIWWVWPAPGSDQHVRSPDATVTAAREDGAPPSSASTPGFNVGPCSHLPPVEVQQCLRAAAGAAESKGDHVNALSLYRDAMAVPYVDTDVPAEELLRASKAYGYDLGLIKDGYRDRQIEEILDVIASILWNSGRLSEGAATYRAVVELCFRTHKCQIRQCSLLRYLAVTANAPALALEQCSGIGGSDFLEHYAYGVYYEAVGSDGWALVSYARNLKWLTRAMDSDLPNDAMKNWKKVVPPPFHPDSYERFLRVRDREIRNGHALQRDLVTVVVTSYEGRRSTHLTLDLPKAYQRACNIPPGVLTLEERASGEVVITTFGGAPPFQFVNIRARTQGLPTNIASWPELTVSIRNDDAPKLIAMDVRFSPAPVASNVACTNIDTVIEVCIAGSHVYAPTTKGECLQW